MNRRMTNIVIVLALLAPGVLGAEERREQSSRDWDAHGLTRVEVENSRGDTSVRPSHDGRVHLVALKLVRHSEGHGADALASGTRLTADQRSGVLQIHVQYPQRREIRLGVWDLVKGIEIPDVEVRLAIEAPPAMLVSLRSASGDLQTSGMTGRQDIHSASGDVDVADAASAVSVETRSGDATLGDVGPVAVSSASGSVVIASARGTVAVETQSGDVRIDAASDSVRVATASGEVRVGLARAGLDVRTASGDIIARGGGQVRIRTASGESKIALIAPLRRAEFSSSSGDVNVRVAPGIECELDADAGSGDVDVQLPLDVRSMKRNHVIGRLGRGTAEIVIRSSSGSVNVAR